MKKDDKKDDDPDLEKQTSTPKAPAQRVSFQEPQLSVTMEPLDLACVRVIYSDMQPREVRTKHTVAATILGVGSQAEAFAFNFAVKGKYGPGVLWGLWFFGAVTGLLAIGRVLPSGFAWVSLLMLPLPAVTVFLLSTDLLREILKSMDLYIIYILQAALFVDGIYFCREGFLWVIWFCYLPSMIAAGLVDAYPAKFRPVFAKMWFGSAVVMLITWNYFLVFRFKIFGDIHKLKNVSFTLHHVSDQLTLGVFYCRHIYCSFYYPEAFVMIKADVVTGHPHLEYHDSPGRAGEEHSHVYLTKEARECEVKMTKEWMTHHQSHQEAEPPPLGMCSSKSMPSPRDEGPAKKRKDNARREQTQA